MSWTATYENYKNNDSWVVNMSTTLFSIENHVKDYLALLSLKVSDNTMDAYKRDLGQFKGFLDDFKVYRPKQLKVSVLTAYFCDLKEQGRAPATIRRKHACIKAFCDYLGRKGFICKNIFKEVVAPKKPPYKIHVPTVEDMARLLALPDTTTEEGARDLAVMELLYSSGLRVSEACNLAVRDVSETQVRIESGKGGKTRTVPITSQANRQITAYLDTWRPKRVADEYLFMQVNGKVMSRLYVARMIKRYALKANIKDLSPHTFRHACATHLLEAGADIRFLQTLLGHSQLEITARYATVTASALTKTFNLTHPRERI